MRIQHNISAMNSYRNFSANNSRLSKNLEKLSTGYAINRAGDDAAGLAISEKMRAQITGLEGATKNAKDGISLIQTAEGALTEVHDMLNRMTTLAEQSANGTYDNDLDRVQLQKEVDSLKSEIDRIADSTNFNGLKLLDGSLSSTGKNGISADLSKLGVDVLSSAKTLSPQKGAYSTGNLINSTSKTATVAGDKDSQFSITLNFTDADGKDQSVTETFYIKQQLLNTSTAGKAEDLILARENGTDAGEILANTKVTGEVTTDAAKQASSGQITEETIAKAFQEILSKNATVAANFNVTTVDVTEGANTHTTLKFEAKMPGVDGAKLNSYSVSKTDNREATNPTKTNYNSPDIVGNPLAEDSTQIYDLSKAKVWKNTKGDPTDITKETRTLEDAAFEVNGKKFVFLSTDATADDIKAMTDAGITNWLTVSTEGNSPTAADVQKMAGQIAEATGLTVQVGHEVTTGTGNNDVNGVSTSVSVGGWDYVEKGASAVAGKDTWVRFIDSEGATEGGLQLQIGDTSDEYNTLKVSVGDMHSKMIGIGDVDISTQKGAGEALDKIKTAINNVSDTRGTLGALQNRLDHTINNLGVMRENIQNAESNIRDTDVAEEMMKYTKNNILNQSAQAMLAQANQLPQGVLQLLG